MSVTRIAIVGCGYIADHYVRTAHLHPQVELIGATDRDPQRAAAFSANYAVRHYTTLDQLLRDSKVGMVLNLTNPSSHYGVSRACLEAGKDVYSEKPLATTMSDAEVLVDLADERGLQIASAPSNYLGESAQTLWRALRENKIGPVRLAYAELDDGLVHISPYKKWFSRSGIPWPYKDEFEVGCTLEHAGYYVTWLTAFFGPACTVSAFGSCLIPDKKTDVPLDGIAPDFTVACIQFASGVVARLTCSIVAPHDHSMRIVGDQGVLSVRDCWNQRSPIYLQQWMTIRSKLLLNPFKKRLRLAGRREGLSWRRAARRDRVRGVAELADSITEGRPCRLGSRFCLHTTEIVLAIHNAWQQQAPCELTTTFDPVEPMPWAQE